MVECFVCGAHTLALSHLFSPWYISPLNFFTHSPLLLLVSPAGTECHLLVSFSPGCPFGGVKKKKTPKVWGGWYAEVAFSNLESSSRGWMSVIWGENLTSLSLSVVRRNTTPIETTVFLYLCVLWISIAELFGMWRVVLHTHVSAPIYTDMSYSLTWVQRVYCLAICLISIQPSNR